MKYVDIRDLPPCSFSPQCLRLIDDLDLPPTVPAQRGLAYIEDLQDERQLRRLRSHVHGCPTCSALLLEARRMRTQQRKMLYHFMLANERQVPATSGAIFEAIRREKRADEAQEALKTDLPARESRASKQVSVESEASLLAPIPLYPRPAHPRQLVRNMLTLATVAAVILAAVGLLNRFIAQPGGANNPTSNTSQPGQSPQPGSNAPADDWNSVVIGLTVLSAAGMVQGLTFANYDPSSGNMTTLLTTTQTLLSVSTDGVSNDGLSFAYESTTTDEQKVYSTLTTTAGVKVHPFYRVSAKQGGNAIWMDTTHLLVQSLEGQMVWEMDATTGALQHTWSLQTGRLSFYHQPFLYFTQVESLNTSALYRADLSQAHPTPQRVTEPLPGTRFWLSTDGSTVFYARRGSASVQGIYAVDSDGSNLRLLRKGSGIPIGYTADHALMVLDEVSSKFQVLKLGTTSSATAQVIMADAAPGAVSLCPLPDLVGVIKVCDQNITLAPNGHGLLLSALSANGTSSLVYDNLDAGTSQVVRNLPAGTSVQLPGWSKISLTNAASAAFSSLAA